MLTAAHVLTGSGSADQHNMPCSRALTEHESMKDGELVSSYAHLLTQLTV